MTEELIAQPLTTPLREAMDAGAALARIQTIDPYADEGLPYIVVPDGYKLEDLEHILPAPTRKRGTTDLTDAKSFIAVVKSQKRPETSLYSTINPPSFTAVFNDTADGAGWGDHRASYVPPLSPEWVTWVAASGRQQTQADFAQFIETNLPDIAEPAGADVLTVARTLEAKKKVNFASGVRLSDGSVQFVYEEDVQGSAQKGQMQIPETFVLAIPVFEGGDLWRMDANLRYRIQDGGRLTIWYELLRPHKVQEAAVNELRAQISAATDLMMLSGRPADIGT